MHECGTVGHGPCTSVCVKNVCICGAHLQCEVCVSELDSPAAVLEAPPNSVL